MPIYNSQCTICKKKYDYISPISECNHSMPDCCGVQTVKKIFAAPMVNAYSSRVFENYECPVTGDVVTNCRQKKYIEDKHDLIIREKGMGLNKEQRKEKTEEAKKYTNKNLPNPLKTEFNNEVSNFKANYER